MNEKLPKQEPRLPVLDQQEKMDTEQRIEAMLEERGFVIADRNFEKQWGGYFVIADDQTKKFTEEFFKDHQEALSKQEAKLSPKILVVGPLQQLSWQYHDRRAEWHKVVEGPVAYPLSETDDQPEAVTYQAGDLIQIPQGTRHRLVGLGGWGVVAEIWQHTDPEHPSDEADNHRLQDFYGRA